MRVSKFNRYVLSEYEKRFQKALKDSVLKTHVRRDLLDALSTEFESLSLDQKKKFELRDSKDAAKRLVSLKNVERMSQQAGKPHISR